MDDDRRAKAKADAEAKTAHADWMRPISIAPFELSDIFTEWATRHFSFADLDGLGMPLPEAPETDREFGDRIARGVLKLLKEV